MPTARTDAAPAIAAGDGDRGRAGRADRRPGELESVHALSRALASAASCREALAGALGALVVPGRFARGEAWLAEGEEVPVRSAQANVTVGDGPGPPQAAVVAAAAEGRAREQDGWQLVPVADRAVLALHGGPPVSAWFLDEVAEVAAAALERARLHERLVGKEAQRSRLLRALLTAQEEERGRISRDLHDQIGQALTAMLLAIDRQLERPDLAALAELRELARVALGDVRRIALDLRPSVLDELGLAAALRRAAREQGSRFGVDVNVLVALPDRLARDEETVLYRVAQEALGNALRHGRATVVSVVVTVRDGSAQLVVEDDGLGFDPDALAPGQRLGLMGMRERLELAGGSLRVESAPGAGCRVHARLPLR